MYLVLTADLWRNSCASNVTSDVQATRNYKMQNTNHKKRNFHFVHVAKIYSIPHSALKQIDTVLILT